VRKLTLMLLCFSFSASNADVSIYVSCNSHTRYTMYPWGFEKSPEVENIYDERVFHRILEDKSQKEKQKAEEYERKAEEYREIVKLGPRAGYVGEIDDLSEEEAKKLALHMFKYVGAEAALASPYKMRDYKSLDYSPSNKNVLLIQVFKDIANEYISDNGLDAELIDSTFTKCDLDEDLTSIIIQHTIEYLKYHAKQRSPNQ
jgi:hypothetical protein